METVLGGGQKASRVGAARSAAPLTRCAHRKPQHIRAVVCWKNSNSAEGKKEGNNLDTSLVSGIVGFPGEDAPGTGLRHLPKLAEPAVNPMEKHAMRTTYECYERFPEWLHASCPLEVDDPEPTGMSALNLPDAGPTSGHRRRPQPAENGDRPLDPSKPKSVMARLRELEIRHHGC